MKITNRDKVILVDEKDNAIGVMDKLLAHQNSGHRHRAFSIFVLNDKDEILLQKRAGTKYHAANLWSNTCCSHPQPDEAEINISARNRLEEELGLEVDIAPIGIVEYKTAVTSLLTEWEIDHLFIGRYANQTIRPNPQEISEIRWITLEDLEKDMKKNPSEFSPWLNLILPKLKHHLEYICIKNKKL